MAKETCDEHTGCVVQINANKEAIVKISELIEKVRNRPPIWVTFIFMIMTGVIGWLIK